MTQISKIIILKIIIRKDGNSKEGEREILGNKIKQRIGLILKNHNRVPPYIVNSNHSLMWIGIYYRLIKMLEK